METLYSIYPYEVTAASRSKHELEFPDFSLILLPASTMVRWMTNKCVTVLASFITFNVVAFSFVSGYFQMLSLCSVICNLQKD